MIEEKRVEDSGVRRFTLSDQIISMQPAGFWADVNAVA